MKPPIPTQPIPKAKESRPAAWVPACVALLVVLIVAGYVYWQDYFRAAPPPVNPESMAMSRSARGALPPGGDHGDRTLGGFMSSRTVDQLVRLRPGDKPLTGDPAGLPPYPSEAGVKAVRESGFVRDEGGITEEIAWYRVANAALEEVVEHYASAASDAEFTAGSSRRRRPDAEAPTTQPASVNRMFFRPAAAERDSEPFSNEVLILRAHRDGESVRVMLWFRYPSANPGRGAADPDADR